MSVADYAHLLDPLNSSILKEGENEDGKLKANRMALTQLNLYFKEDPVEYFTATNKEIGKHLPQQDPLILRHEHRRNYITSKLIPENLRIETAYSRCVNISKAPFTSLKRIAISDLTVSISSTKGCYLFLRTLELPIFLIGIRTVVEDHTGEVAPFTVFNFFSSTSGMKPEDVFPPGTVFILKEPLLKLSEGGDHVLHCDCPTDMMVLHKYHSNYNLVEQVSWKNAVCEAQEERTPVSLDEWKTLGNAYYRRNNLPKALEAYLVALKLTLTLNNILMSNVSATYLRMESFESALLYSKYVLEHEPDNLKAIFRTGRAHYELRQYDEAYHCFKSALKVDPSNQEVTKELERCSQRLDEQQGNVNIYKLFLTSTLKPKTLIDCADYTGPIEVVPILGKGRGFVATEPIIPGTLLCVSKAVHVSFGENGSHIEAAKLVGRTTQTVLRNPEVFGSKIYDLQGGRTNTESRKLRNGDDQMENNFVDVERIRKIVSTNYYSIEKADLSRPANIGIGLFLTTSYLNHSCIFNASWTTYNDIMVIHAVKPIDYGEEVTISYCAHAEEYVTRKEYFSERGFQCTCLLCEADREESIEVLSLRYDLTQQFQNLRPRVGEISLKDSVKVVEEMKKVVKEIEVACKTRGRKTLKYSLLIPYMRLSLAMTEMGHLAEMLKYAEKALITVGLDTETLLQFSEGAVSLTKHSLISFEWFNIVVYAVCAFTMVGRKAEAKRWFKVLVMLENMYSGGNEQMAKNKYLRGISNHVKDNEDICCTH